MLWFYVLIYFSFFFLRHRGIAAHATRSLDAAIATCISITAFLGPMPCHAPNSLALRYIRPPPTYPASALFRCSPRNPVASVLICASPAFVIFLLRFLPSCFCSTRVFTQIHCFNLLKFVDRKQKLINAWARNGWLSGSVAQWFGGFWRGYRRSPRWRSSCMSSHTGNGLEKPLMSVTVYIFFN